MRKITLFLMSLFLTVGAMAQKYVVGEAVTNIEDGLYVVMAETNAGGGSYSGPVYYNNGNYSEKYLVNNYSITTGTQLTDGNYIWRIVNSNGKITLQNLQDNVYFVKDNAVGNNFSGTTTAELELERINANSDTNKRFYMTLEDASIGYIHANHRSQGACLSYWNEKAESGSCVRFLFYEVEELAPCTITYNYKEDDKLIASIEHIAYPGDDYPELDSPICGSVTFNDSKPTGPVAGKEDVDIQVTTEGIPFEFANSYSEIKKWYYLMFDTNGSFYLRHKAGQGYIALTNNEKNPDDENISNCMWAFVGNPFVGYKIVNHATGEGYILSSSTTMSGTQGGGTHPIMKDEKNLQSGNEYWIPTSSTHRTNGFYLAQKGFSDNRMNNRDNALAYWTGGAGTGSTFWVEECTSFNVTVSDLGFATLYLDYAAYIPSGVEVYIITKDDINNGYVTLTPVTGVLPANTGVIVKASKGSYTFYKSTADVTITGNLLSGTTENTVINEAAYVLGNNGGIGMYKAELNKDADGNVGTTHFLNNANKAYLPASAVPANVASSASLRFDFGGTTGVEEVETEVAETVIYDLTGRRVNEITKAGVYIIGGRKILVK